jgi:hypothetical protein
MIGAGIKASSAQNVVTTNAVSLKPTNYYNVIAVATKPH